MPKYRLDKKTEKELDRMMGINPHNNFNPSGTQFDVQYEDIRRVPKKRRLRVNPRDIRIN